MTAFDLLQNLKSVCPVLGVTLLNNPPTQASDVQVTYDPSATAQQQAAAQVIVNGLAFVPFPPAVQNAISVLQAYPTGSTQGTSAQQDAAIKACRALFRFMSNQLGI